jgi:hypothetical protein
VALALGTAAIILLVLLWQLAVPHLHRLRPGLRALWERLRVGSPVELCYDPGRERRAEQRARTLLSSCVNEEEWAMYRDLGFLRVWGAQGRRSAAVPPGGSDGAAYAYLIYPHKPLLAYLPQTGQLLNEYCVAFPDEERPYGSARLPDADDVLAKWMALKADERGLIERANMHLPGRQIDPARVARDLQRLSRWERLRVSRALTPTLAPPPAGPTLASPRQGEADRRSGLGQA